MVNDVSTSIVDSHQHFWQVGRFDYPWMSPELGVLYQDYLPADLEPLLKRCDVEKTVLVQASNSLAETRWLLSLAEQNPFIAGVVGWVNLTSETLQRELDEFVAHPKFKGVRHLVESEPADDWLNQPGAIRGLQTLGKSDVSYDLLVHTRHLKCARTVAEQRPELRLVVDHMAKPPIARHEISEWAMEIKKLAAYPNVWCKLSGLVTEADWKSWRVEDLQPFVDRAMEYFGPQRMMFGSDWPVCLLAATYDQVLDAAQLLVRDLNSEERDRIFRRNAIDFYRLEDEAEAF
jgi:L-fucono-1,5-lactonase